jgi:hypothetical protein
MLATMGGSCSRHGEMRKAKGKVVPVFNQAPQHNDVWGSGGMVHAFLTLALDGGD